RPIAGGNRAASDVEPDQELADIEQEGGHDGANQHVPPFQILVGQYLVDRREQDRDQDDSEGAGEDTGRLPGGAPNDVLQQLRTLLSHEPAELTDDCSSGGVLAEGEASNGDHDEQNRAGRRTGVEGDSRSTAQR